MSSYDYEFDSDEHNEKLDRQADMIMGVFFGTFFFFTVVRPLLQYFNVI